jgi:hypothetical protein
LSRYAALREKRDELAKLITLEMGKQSLQLKVKLKSVPSWPTGTLAEEAASSKIPMVASFPLLDTTVSLTLPFLNKIPRHLGSPWAKMPLPFRNVKSLAACGASLGTLTKKDFVIHSDRS